MIDVPQAGAPRRFQNAGALVALIVLAASIPSFMNIPFRAPWPLDFQNLWTFHDCAARDQPYGVAGAACGDALGRDMLYPPLLYWSFVWTRWLTFGAASQVWTIFVALGTAAATLAWIPRAWTGTGASPSAAFAALLLAQYPLLFSLERGNNDVIVLVMWTLASIAFRAGRPGASGAIAGLSAVTKLYPVFACVVAGTAIAATAARRPAMRSQALAFVTAGVVATVLGVAVSYPQSAVYATQILPAISHKLAPLWHYGHPLRHLWPLWGGWALSLPILVAWVAAAVLVFDRDPILVFAGSLAISTFFAPTTWDYNLITTFPLLVVLFTRATSGASRVAMPVLLLGLVAIVGHRGLFAWGETAMRVHIALQWTFLVATAAAAPWIAARDVQHASWEGAAPASLSGS